MDFRIADTFVDSLAELTGEEQKAVKTTAFDLQLNPANPGFQFHKLDKARDKHFWSVRVSSDIRIIVHRTEKSLLLCYVDHHDDAYRWAERRKLEIHPVTGAAQLVEIRETVREIPSYQAAEFKDKPPLKPPLLAHFTADVLLGYGVPADWLEDVRRADEDSILELAGHLPAEAAEAVLNLATGSQPPVPALPEAPEPALLSSEPVLAEMTAPSFEDTGPFDHPDARRRFRVITNVEELELALDYPWEKWTVFLHPAQRQLVEKHFGGPARVSGSAGTGKTVVALHRAVFLTRSHPDARVLLATFSETLAKALRIKLKRLIGTEPRLGERLEVHAMDAIGQRLYALHDGQPRIASRQKVRELIETAAAKVQGHKFSLHFLFTEWEQVVDAWQLDCWEAYRDVARLGRKTRLAETQRRLLWSIFEQVRTMLKTDQMITRAGMFAKVTDRIATSGNPAFDFCVIDEAQDIGVPQLRFLAAMGGGRPDSLFFAGDLGQRIFQQPFSWKAIGVDIRGRSRTLRINYRTSHQIRMQADRLLGPELADVDGNVEQRGGTISVFNGPAPLVKILATENEEANTVAQWLGARMQEGLKPHETGVFVRSEAQLERAVAAVGQAGYAYSVLDEKVEMIVDRVAISTMHLAKGLEFRAVVVMACDDEIIPLQQRIQTVADDADLEEAYNTERHLLYVACTRARDHLMVTGVDPASEFLDDLKP